VTSPTLRFSAFFPSPLARLTHSPTCIVKGNFNINGSFSCAFSPFLCSAVERANHLPVRCIPGLCPWRGDQPQRDYAGAAASGYPCGRLGHLPSVLTGITSSCARCSILRCQRRHLQWILVPRWAGRGNAPPARA